MQPRLVQIADHAPKLARGGVQGAGRHQCQGDLEFVAVAYRGEVGERIDERDHADAARDRELAKVLRGIARPVGDQAAEANA
jgi:hypothetical protein